MSIDPLANPDHPLWEPTAEVLADPRPPNWNTSRHDPWWHAWLLSWQLFATYREMAPRVGAPIHDVLGGTVFEYRPDGISICVQVWIAPGELLVAYPSMAEAYGVQGPQYGGLHEFAEWIAHLRDSPPLELGRVRDRCSYGARWSGNREEQPDVKWAQAGDWAALARNWFIERVNPTLALPT